MVAKTSHKKWIYVFPVFISMIPTHLLLSKVGETPWGWIASREIKFRRRLFKSSIKCNIKRFHVAVMQKRERNLQKDVIHV